MAEPTDAIMPILQRIQSDVAEIKSEHGRRLTAIEAKLTENGEKLSEMNGYLSFNLGITSRHTGEIETLRGEIDAISSGSWRWSGRPSVAG